MDAPTREQDIPVQAVIFGGGIAGLWLLDQLHERGYSALLLEANALGHGQTIASQGIIHGGLKYTLQGMLTRSATQIREMPGRWQSSLVGVRHPDLSQTPLRSEHCFLWRTESLRSKLGMIGAQVGLRVAPTSLNETERPAVLQHCPGTVARLDEQVLSPAGLVRCFLDQHQDRLLKIDRDDGFAIRLSASGAIEQIRLYSPDGQQHLTLCPEQVIFTAGRGNTALRERCGLSTEVGQTRPLHMVMVRGNLPWLNGHCVDGAKTRVTITSEQTGDGNVLWQLGGQIAELGVDMSRGTLLSFAAKELEAAIPGIDLSGTEWSSYRVDRAEPVTPDGKRPDQAYFLHEHNIWTAWPTKLALAPQLSDQLIKELTPVLSSPHTFTTDEHITQWPCPDVASYPWETETNWSSWTNLTTPAVSRAA